MVVVRLLGRIKRNMGITRRKNTEWRPHAGILQEPKQTPEIVFGTPQFETTWDVLNGRGSSFRRYRPPPKPLTVSRNPEDYNAENFHTLMGKFRFEAFGLFHKRGENAEKEAFDAAFDLHLVGWMKVRKTFMLGHVQGDVYALSYFQRWLEEKHLTPEAGTIQTLRFWEVNTGLDTPLEYGFLRCVKDHRRYGKKKVHIQKVVERQHIGIMERNTALDRKQHEAFMDDHCVRNY